VKKRGKRKENGCLPETREGKKEVRQKGKTGPVLPLGGGKKKKVLFIMRGEKKKMQGGRGRVLPWKERGRGEGKRSVRALIVRGKKGGKKNKKKKKSVPS